MRARAVGGLALGVLAISWGAPLARLTNAAPLAIAGWRMILATALLLVLALVRGRRLLASDHRPGATLAGVFLGAHFGLWVPSLWLTSVSASVVLVSTAPLFVLLASPRFLGVPIRRRNVASLVLALTGIALIAWGDVQISPKALVGDALALAGAAAECGYLVIGKRLRRRVALDQYLTVVYGVAALTLAAVVLAAGVEPLPDDRISWLPLLGMAVGPTLLGHGSLNWALAHLEAYQVNLAVLLEPVLASVWAWLILAEVPPFHVVPGAILVIGALALEVGARGQRTTG